MSPTLLIAPTHPVPAPRCVTIRPCPGWKPHRDLANLEARSAAGPVHTPSPFVPSPCLPITGDDCADGPVAALESCLLTLPLSPPLCAWQSCISPLKTLHCQILAKKYAPVPRAVSAALTPADFTSITVAYILPPCRRQTPPSDLLIALLTSTARTVACMCALSVSVVAGSSCPLRR